MMGNNIHEAGNQLRKELMQLGNRLHDIFVKNPNRQNEIVFPGIAKMVKELDEKMGEIEKGVGKNVGILHEGEKVITQEEAKQMNKVVFEVDEIWREEDEKEWNEKTMKQAVNEQEHLNHPFYKKVDVITAEVAKGQILKGAAKYDEPFNPDSWTGEELGNHALEELRDGQVYVVGMVEKIKGLEEGNRRLKEELYNYERGIFKDQKVEALIKENGKLTDRLTTIDKNSYVHLRKEIEDLRKVLSKLYVSYDAIWDEKAGLEDEVERLKEEKLKYLENGI